MSDSDTRRERTPVNALPENVKMMVAGARCGRVVGGPLGPVQQGTAVLPS
jgi:hypothetical protein